MKDITNSKTINNKVSIEYQDLKAINERIKKFNTRDKGITELLSIEFKNLESGLKLYWLYLRGKIHEYESHNRSTLLNLEEANRYYDEIFIEAKVLRVQVKNSKYFSKRANTKHKLSMLVSLVEDREGLKLKAKCIVEEGLEIHPNNSALLFLKGELEK